MLSEEEQAVENLEKLVKLRKNIRGEITHDTCICGTSDLDTGLKLINKLKKENEELSKKNIENICKGAEEEVLQEYRDKITKLQKENKEKDKQIDLMAEELSNIDFDKMCEKCKCGVGYGCDADEDEDIDLYMNCIKRYFEKLAKEKG